MIDAVLWIAGGLATILVIAIVVGIVDAANATTWRQIAAERRDRWEAQNHRDYQHNGISRDD